MLSPDEVLKQSKSAFEQWEGLWRDHANTNGERHQKSGNTVRQLVGTGVGKKLLCIATGSSLEDHIDIIKKYQSDAVDILCVDKCLSILLDNGIKPTYVLIADAQIDYEKWCKPYIDQTKDIVLFSVITANPEWNENWKGDVFFYTNKDNIQSEEIFIPLSKCYETIPASSNVGNSLLVFASSILGYDEHLLTGFDYSWGDDQNYYAFNDGDKRYFMKHTFVPDNNGYIVNTSQNLLFSSRWLADFGMKLAQDGVRVTNCSGRGILKMPRGSLEKKMKNAKKRELNQNDKMRIMQAHMQEKIVTAYDVSQDKNALNKALKDVDVSEVAIRYIPAEVKTWLN